MLKMSRLMLMSALWFGACVQAAGVSLTGYRDPRFAAAMLDLEEDPAGKRTPSKIHGFTSGDITFVRDAYNVYLKAVKTAGEEQTKKILAQYCDTLLSRFYGAQLRKMFYATPDDFRQLKQAIAIAYENIHNVGERFITICARSTQKEVQEAIQQYSAENMLRIVLNACDQYGDTAFMSACKNNYVLVVGEILYLNKLAQHSLFDVNAQDSSGNTALMLACQMKHQDIMQQLLQDDVVQQGVNLQNNAGKTALMIACSIKNNYEIIRQLLNLKDFKGHFWVDVDIKDKNDMTALIIAGLSGDMALFQKLLNLKDAKDQLRLKSSYIPTLLYACKTERIAMLRELLNVKDKQGNPVIDVNKQYFPGYDQTLLLYALNNNKLDVAIELLKHGANVDIKFVHLSLQTIYLNTHHNVIKQKALLILKVFYAIDPHVTDAQLASMGQGALELKNAYVDFQKGNPEKLSQRLVEYMQLAPLALLPPDINDMMGHFTLPSVMQSVFKKASIEPLLRWLIDVTLDEDVKSKLENILHGYVAGQQRAQTAPKAKTSETVRHE